MKLDWQKDMREGNFVIHIVAYKWQILQLMMHTIEVIQGAIENRQIKKIANFFGLLNLCWHL